MNSEGAKMPPEPIVMETDQRCLAQFLQLPRVDAHGEALRAAGEPASRRLGHRCKVADQATPLTAVRNDDRLLFVGDQAIVRRDLAKLGVQTSLVDRKATHDPVAVPLVFP